MLNEIRCEKFRTSTIKFHKSLNVVLGDTKATNSIGKSTLLMIIDFVFGGETYLKHNSDTVRELGDHEFLFSFSFDNIYYYFKRSTNTPDFVRICDSGYKHSDIMHIKNFTQFLKEKYDLSEVNQSFREITSRYMRVWGKNNYFVDKPLHGFISENAKDTMISLIHLFGKFELISEHLARLSVLESEKKAIKSAQSNQYLPKISKSQFTENKRKLETIDKQISEIKTNLERFAINLKQVVNEQVMRIKDKKDILLDEKAIINSQLKRIELNLDKGTYIKSKNFNQVSEFFPEINTKRLEEVELFHSKIAQILKSELLKSRIRLNTQLEPINNELHSLDQNLSEITRIENPGIIVDYTMDLFKESTNLHKANEIFEKLERLTMEIKSNKDQEEIIQTKILAEIAFTLNDAMKSIVGAVYQPGHKIPTIQFSNSNYLFNIVDDTGTGQAYSNIIVFDIAIFRTSKIPILIHDSHLFKNIQTPTISGFISQYLNETKQTFIALDEKGKYGPKTLALLDKQRVIELNDARTLFIKDWRTKAVPEP